MSQPLGKLFTLSIMTLRFVLAVWVGAAILYVITSVAEQVAPEFDSRTRDQLAVLRFPLYYRFGFGCHIAAGLAGLLAWRTAPASRRSTYLVVLSLVIVSGILITADLRLIYQPLEAAITPAGQAHGEEFEKLHTWSKRANMVHVAVMAFAALLAMLPLCGVSAAADRLPGDSLE